MDLGANGRERTYGEIWGHASRIPDVKFRIRGWSDPSRFSNKGS